MPIYDVRCRACGATFEINRSMSRADEPAPCPHGHEDTVRLLPTVSMTGRASARAGSPSAGAGPAAGPAGGGCCGGGCCG